MPYRFLALAAIAFAMPIHAAPASAPAPASTPLVPLGVSGTGESSVAWMLDPVKNRILVCRAEYGASSGGSSCNVIQLPPR
ncbi:hypothetical protein [Variovorax sp. JS1663]|uniref:hypothetical protein n=1 Tax=Variovorax sp. JS1663 TaxID=1851577 RepID=UPI000B3498B9|nr:hypothetical protein [Variovorax sp. JS1663]OUL99202.1 hypothetical protein A8M77_27770 [Variovorax sp. JS1663]